MVHCFQRENVSDDSTVVGPAGGTLLFLIAPNHDTACGGRAVAELKETRSVTNQVMPCVFFGNAILSQSWSLREGFSIETSKNECLQVERVLL